MCQGRRPMSKPEPTRDSARMREHLERIARIRQLARAAGRYVAILADLPGPKLRVRLDAPLDLKVGQAITLGRIPQAKADKLMARLPQRIARAVNRPLHSH